MARLAPLYNGRMPTNQLRDLDLLRPDFKERAEGFLSALRREFPGYTVGVHETLRTPERQAWLFEQGRSRPGNIVTWTLNSNHLHGIALDWHFAKEGRAIWNDELYVEAYSKVPPAAYGLETLGSVEQVHIQLLNANQKREAEVPFDAEPDALLIVYDATGLEVLRLEVPAGGSIIDRQRGNRRYIRVEAPQD